MAIPITQDDLGKDKTNQNQGQGQSGQGGGSQAPTVTSYNPNQKGSGFTNVQKVVNANQGNQLGQTIGSKVQQAGQQGQQNINQAQNQFNQQSQANQFNTDENNQLVQKALNDPTSVANGSQLNQFHNLIGGNYQGPTNLNNAQNLQNQTQNIQQLGQSLNNSAGRTGLLQRFVGGPQYQQGQQTLDSLLLGQSNNPALTMARRQALGLQGQLNNALTGAQAVGQENVNKAQQYGQGVQQQFGQTVESQDAALQQQAQAANDQKTAALAKLQQDFTTGNLTADEAKQLGIQNGQQTFNIDPNKFVTANPLAATAQNVATADQYAKLNALRQLGGNYTPTADQDILQKYAGQDSQAGQFAAKGPYDIDQTGFQKAYKTSQDNYNSRFNPAQSQFQAATDINNIAGQIQQKQDQLNQLQGQTAGTINIGGGFSQGAMNPQTKQLQDEISQLQNTINTKYPGAVTNGVTRTDWANTNLQNSQRNFDQIKKQLEDAYGTKKFNVGNS